MKLTQKGFTLIEIIGAVTIIGILSTVSIISVTRYQERTKQQAYAAMEKSAFDAAQAYLQKEGSIFTGSKTITIETLVNKGYLQALKDPTGDSNCAGEVVVTRTKGNSQVLDNYKYVVKINCLKCNGNVTFES